MTSWNDVKDDSKYFKVLDHGFVGLIDHMGSDNAVVQAARTSYGSGTRTVREDRGLIRYLMKHKHTSPFEMNVVKLHIKLPIFVMRQLVRHRTSSLNEYSGRYSIMTDEFYIPELNQIKPQSKDNKQGRAGELLEADAIAVRNLIDQANKHNYNVYEALIGQQPSTMDIEYPEDLGLTTDFNGIARELARTVLPVGNYTELYWTQNLHNMFHLLKLRMDPHAQYEIRVFAEAIYEIVKGLFPICTEAFEDYLLNAESVSGTDRKLLDDIIRLSNEKEYSFKHAFNQIYAAYPSETEFLEYYRLGKREIGEFKSQWSL